jgi:hypothetical protein
MTMDLSGNKLDVLATALRFRIEWCDGELAKQLSDDVRKTITDERETLVAMLASLRPARRATEPGHA